MRKLRSLSLALCAIVYVPFAIGAGAPNLPQSVEAATNALSAAQVDRDACRQLATDLLDGVSAYPASNLAGDALYLAVKLERIAGDHEAALAAARRILLDYPRSEHAPEAFQYVWDAQTSQGANPSAGAETAREFAESLGNAPNADSYYEIALDAYAAGNQWKEAAELCRYFLETAAMNSDLPELYITVADVALRADENSLARDALDQFSSRYSPLPQMVMAKNRLGHVHMALGNREPAKQAFSQAWTLFTKHRGKPGYVDHDVRHAAAEALWTLQSADKDALDRMAAQGLDVNESQLRKIVRKLTDACAEITEADSHFALQTLTAMGDATAILARQVGSARLSRVKSNASAASEDSPIAEALDLCARAAEYYTAAFEYSCESTESRSARAASDLAAEKVFEIMRLRADLQNQWALELLERNPPQMPGTRDDELRLRYLIKTVAPVAMTGLDYVAEVLDLPSYMPIDEQKSALRSQADATLKIVAQELFSQCQEQWRQTASAAIQVGSSVSFGIRTSNSSNLVEGLDDKVDMAARFAASACPELSRIAEAVSAREIWPDGLSFWIQLEVRMYAEYTQACATVAASLQDGAGRMKVHPDSPDGSLKTLLLRLARSGADDEYRYLVHWHDRVAEMGADIPLNQRMQMRLAELNPKLYGLDGTYPSANRQP